MKKFTALFLGATLALATLAGCADGASSSKSAKVIDFELTEEEYAFGVDKKQPELLDQVNDVIAEMKEDGSFDEICNHYFGDGEPVAVTSAELDNSKADKQLVVATNAAFEPFEYMKGDSYYGIDMEMAKAIADKLDMELVIQNMEFSAVVLSVNEEKCDIAMAGLTVTEDRKEAVNFTESYYNAAQKLVVPSDDTFFADCKDADDVTARLAELEKGTKIGVQTGTTGQFFLEGDEDFGFDGFKNIEAVGYSNGSLAVQDMLNDGNAYVIIDSAPAACITEAINAMN